VFTFSFKCYSQSPIPQLKKELAETSDIKEKTRLYIDISWEYLLITNDSSLFYAKEGYKFAKDNNYAFGKVITLEMQGIYYESVENVFDKAIESYIEAIEISKANNIDYLDSLHLSLGTLFQQQGDFEKAGEYYQIALKSARDNEHLDVVKITLVNLGLIQGKQGKFEIALQNLEESLSYPAEDRESNDAAYANIARIKMQQGLNREATNFLEKSISTKEAKYDIRYSNNFAKIIENKIILNDKSGLDTLVPILENFYTSSETINDKLPLSIILSSVYEFNKDFEKALEYKQENLIYLDSINMLARDDLVYDFETKYETQRTKDALIKKEREQKLFLILSIIGLIVASFLGILFYNNRKKKRLLAKQTKLLEATIDEKNVLLRETHHRVKNSFQIVSSLLYLQSESVEDKEAKIAIKEAENRVRSMVLIHQKLYNKDELVGINTKDYFGDLVRDIFESHQFKAESINYNLNVEPLVLDIETITPVGLILNELIVNILKHAFDDITSKSKIDIQFNKEGENLELKVTDNGKGFEGEIKSTSFGITLMKALSKKLNATLNYNSKLNEGTEATLVMLKFKLL
jgi:two-component sensor histidine kinase